ncbi:MAG: MxaD family protein [Candidatus Poribacteria bacterium]|nr:MAG: MxaD family protein [Candidatus Poribacteria bacterium]
MAKVAVTVKFAKPAREVWAIIGGFLTIGEWNPGVAKCTPKFEGNDIIRHLELADGGYVVEPLLYYDAAGMEYAYAITEGTLPFRDYVARLRVLEDDNGASCIVQWTASFTPTADEAEVVDLVANGVFRASLNALKERLGA